jgi:hypothetical protein
MYTRLYRSQVICEDYIDERDHYIVIDCVKDRFDDEQPYLECKDYDMRLDYLDGIERRQDQRKLLTSSSMTMLDLSDLASVYDEDEMGNIFKKVGKCGKENGEEGRR